MNRREFSYPDERDREISEELSVMRTRLSERGFMAKSGWDENGPLDITINPPWWVDHAWQYVDPYGNDVYVTEPYHVGTSELREILELSENWEINFKPVIGRHFPSHTNCILFKAHKENYN